MSKHYVLVVEDDPRLQSALLDTLKLSGFDVICACDGQQALDLIQSNNTKLIISDIQMSNMDGMHLLKKIKTEFSEIPIILMTAYGTIQQAVQAMQNGALDYLVKPFDPEVLVSKVSQFLPLEDNYVAGVVVEDPATKAVFSLAQRVADSDATVMLTGESGTGKEVLIQFIHHYSKRRDKPFVAVNCAAIPDNMLEAILFGYQKGAYTGAYKACPGKFEQAQAGMLLLDEVSEMNLALQAKLLRVLQERKVERLGDNKSIDLDVRIAATSNRNLQQEVVSGRFREDLYYRLNVFPINMPSLRDRPDDIIPLCEFMLRRIAQENNNPCPLLSDAIKQRLLEYHWPGNIRELDNLMQRAFILQDEGRIDVDHLHFENTSDVNIEKTHPAIANGSEKLSDNLKVMEKEIILGALAQCMGSRKATAEKLGISTRALRYKLAQIRKAGVAI